jgi:prophage antirepressor-like protein
MKEIQKNQQRQKMELMTFTFKSTKIRVVGTPDPLFVAKDICDPLGYEKPSFTLRILKKNEKGVHEVHTLGGPQNMAVVTEKGLWRLVSKSTKPEAEELVDWVFGEVLPSIRKTGAYLQTAVQPVPVWVSEIANINVEHRSGSRANTAFWSAMHRSERR